MAPVYGLAENAVAVTLPPPGRLPIIDRIDRTALSTRGIAEPARPDDFDAIELVACGHPIPDHEVRIVDDMGREVGERQEGRLEFRGPSATSGYFENPAKTRELFHDGWLDTGDRAYMAGGDLFITGRIKDIIIRAGQHIAPHEIEEAVGAIPGLRKNGVAAFGVTDPASGTERVVILAETEESDPSGAGSLESSRPGGCDPHRRRPAGRDRARAARHGSEDRERQDQESRGKRPLSGKELWHCRSVRSGGSSRA